MNALSVNSVNNLYVRTAVAQQRVAIDRGNVLEAEAQLNDYQTQLDEDLTYLSKLQHRSHEVQQLQGSQAATNAQDRIEIKSRSAQQASQQASAALQSITAPPQAVGTNINVVA